MSDQERLPVVTVPDAEDFAPELGIKKDPVRVQVKTDTGDMVRPVVIVALLNRQQKRMADRIARKRAKDHPEEQPPLILRQKVDPAVVTDRVADLMLKEWEEYHRYFPLATLQQYLDDRTAKTLEEAILRGKPLDRDAVRRALGALMQEHANEQKGN